MLVRLLVALYRRFAHLVQELAKFGTVGVVGFVIDVGGSNVLWHGAHLGPLTGKTISAAAAATFAYFANRYWTFRHRRNSGLAREYVLFFLLNGAATLISLICLGFTVYTLGLDNSIARNISGNIIGVALGTAFRYWSYKRWVFLPGSAPPVDPHTGLPEVDEQQDQRHEQRQQHGGGPAAQPSEAPGPGPQPPVNGHAYRGGAENGHRLRGRPSPSDSPHAEFHAGRPSRIR